MATKSSTRSRSKSAATRKRNAAQQRARKQMRALVLFAVGILVGALTLIEGASVWQWLHNTLFGIFGCGAIAVAALLIYIAVLDTQDKPVAARAWEGGLLVVFFCGAWQIFKMGAPVTEDAHVMDMLIESILMGIKGESGGFVGAVVGLPLLTFFDKLGAGIIIVLALFVLIMLMTGGTLIGLARAAHKPVQKIGESYAEQMQRQEERRAQRAAAPAQKKRTIDIPLDEPPRRGKNQPASDEPAQPAAAEGIPAAAAPQVALADAPAQHAPKFDIDIPLDDNFEPDAVGGFSLSVSDEPMQFVPSPEPSIDELVHKAATETGKFAFKADEPIQPEVVSVPESVLEKASEETFSSSLNLPPLLDDDPVPLEHPEPGQAAPSEPPADKGKPDEGIQLELAQEASIPVQPIYIKPSLGLLREPRQKAGSNVTDEMKQNAQRLVDTLASFGVQTRIVDISRGPAVTRYELQPSAGVKISRITGLADDIALNLAAAGVRIEAPIPNKAAVGIEVPNKVISAVSIREIIDSSEFMDAKSKLTVALGRDIAGNTTVADIGKMPHLLIAGSTGSGKSVCINSIIISLLYKSTPDEVRFLMIDPKVVELGVYNGIPQLLVPVVTDPKKAAGALSWAVTEMLKRYKLFADNSVRDLSSYNHLAEKTEGMQKLPQVVIIIDELADLMMAAPNEIEDYICRLAQMARAAGMHLIIATQRPSVDVITGVIKANIPSRIAFAVSSQVDSRTILDMGGAEKLLGRGDMLFNPVGAPKPVRVQGCFVTDEEIENVIAFIKNDATADYDDSIVQEIDNHVVAGKGGKGSSSDSSSNGGDSDEDEMLMPAIECVVEAGMASTSLLQRRLKLGYARAARIVDEMEARGIVGPFEGSKPRQVLISPERWAEMKLSQQE
ncbi:FtsK/SpoIIIE family DNA translocase [Anaerotruncus rubiinfantis]|uniref:FtsK/SpoIIIE family DNA translocase n=1 Tax=Anaerotruncus rubiinfantis TaxID=1720200 RepID=UPI00082E9D77|nr:DNA translocase FtsK [Anaerotruncus rubiinfantis]